MVKRAYTENSKDSDTIHIGLEISAFSGIQVAATVQHHAKTCVDLRIAVVEQSSQVIFIDFGLK